MGGPGSPGLVEVRRGLGNQMAHLARIAALVQALPNQQQRQHQQQQNDRPTKRPTRQHKPPDRPKARPEWHKCKAAATAAATTTKWPTDRQINDSIAHDQPADEDGQPTDQLATHAPIYMTFKVMGVIFASGF